MSTNEARVLATFMIWAAVACILIFGKIFGPAPFPGSEIPVELGATAILGGCAWLATQAVWSSGKSEDDEKQE